MSPSSAGTDADSGVGCFRLAVMRSGTGAAAPRFQEYELQAGPRTSVLEALLRLQDEQDPSLAFRYSCRGAVCGSCAMSIDGRLNLACRVLLGALGAAPIVVEPLPHLTVLKDLVVDMDPFWAKYESVRPWLHRQSEAAEEARVSPAERQRLEAFVDCILCGLCYGACPVLDQHEDFAGPAALAHLHRFVADVREGDRGADLAAVDSDSGVWGCRTVERCAAVCPRHVRPSDGVAGLRRRLLVHRLRRP
jgi:succinate dehydrogenase / fumarate reductase iron-sulfur subunit